MNTTDLTKYFPVQAIVENYEAAKVELESGYANIHKANNRIQAICGNYSKPSHHNVLDSYALKNDITAAKKILWRFIFNKCDIYNLVSEARRKELDKQIESGELPEITVNNIQDTLDGLLNNIGNLYKETVAEAFEFLRPPSSRHKTNTEYEVGKKAIKEWMFDCSYGCSLSYSREPSLRSLDNAFHLMDGQGAIKYPGDIVTAIQDAIQKKNWEAETTYFRLKWYKIGTLHIEFKRMDLVTKMNAMAGGNRLHNAA